MRHSLTGARDEPPSSHDSAARPRLGATTRVFVCCSVFAIVVRSVLNTFMHHVDWRDELGMFTMPYPLPGAAERAALGNDAEGEALVQEGRGARHRSLHERLGAAGASVLRFASPLPPAKTAQRLATPAAWLKYALVWAHTRLEFIGRLIGVDERWTMFSPTVGTQRNVVRAMLVYADGSSVVMRSLVEPDDFMTFVRPFSQRRLQHDINLTQLDDVRTNWCKYLARAHPRNASGSPLRSIGLYQLSHALPAPGTDAAAHWQAQNAAQLPSTPTWRFDVTAGVLTEVDVSEDRSGSTHDGE